MSTTQVIAAIPRAIKKDETYTWAGGFYPPVSADVFKREWDRLTEKLDRAPTASDLVDAARDTKHPLHPCFTWDEKTAAQAYRADQAKALIRHLRVTFSKGPVINVPMRALFHVKIDGERGWVESHDALSKPDFRKQILHDALRDLKSFSAKYAYLLTSIGAEVQATELSEAIERALVEH